MSLADQLLIGWWVAAGVLLIAQFIRAPGKRTILFYVISGTAFICYFAILFFRNETRLYYLNSLVFQLILGTMLICTAIYAPVIRLKSRALRIFSFAFGTASLIAGAIGLIQNLFYPWQVVEGRVDALRNFPITHQVIIDGRLYFATNEVNSTLKIGDRIRAEGTQRPFTIFRATPIP